MTRRHGMNVTSVFGPERSAVFDVTEIREERAYSYVLQ